MKHLLGVLRLAESIDKFGETATFLIYNVYLSISLFFKLLLDSIPRNPMYCIHSHYFSHFEKNSFNISSDSSLDYFEHFKLSLYFLVSFNGT